MNTRMMPTRNAAPSPVPANEDPSNTGFSGDFQDLCSFGMDQALGIEQVSLAAVVALEFMRTRYLQECFVVQSSIRKFSRHNFPGFSFLFGNANELLHPLAPYAWAPVSTVAETSARMQRSWSTVWTSPSGSGSRQQARSRASLTGDREPRYQSAIHILRPWRRRCDFSLSCVISNPDW